MRREVAARPAAWGHSVEWRRRFASREHLRVPAQLVYLAHGWPGELRAASRLS